MYDGVLLGFALGHRERYEDGDHDVRHWYLLTARESDASAFYERSGARPAGRMGVHVRSL